MMLNSTINPLTYGSNEFPYDQKIFISHFNICVNLTKIICILLLCRARGKISFLYPYIRINPLALATGSRTITSDRIIHKNSSLSFPFQLVDTISLDRNYSEVINVSFVLPGLHLNILKTERMLQFGMKNTRRAWHIIPAQEFNLQMPKRRHCMLRG